VDRESVAVVRACYRILGDVHAAEDAAQEAFVTAFRSLAAWRGDGPFGAWLARIAVRIALREAGRRRPVAWIDPIETDAGGRSETMMSQSERAVRSTLTAGALAAMETSDPAALAMHAERAADVRAAVARLDEPYREVVAMRFFGDLSLAEIAAASGRPLGTVKTHLHRGLRRLRDNLENREAGRGGNR
jgi:RNA polymerase sigma-70 factor (ECF subfamily)